MSNNLGDYLRNLRGNESLRSVSARTEGELSHSYISDLEKGISRRGNVIKPSPHALKTLAVVYDADYNILMNLAGYTEETDKKYFDLTDKEKKDIAIQAEQLMEGLKNDGDVNFYGEPATESQKERLLVAIRTAMEMNKEEAKKKFTPKKHRE